MLDLDPAQVAVEIRAAEELNKQQHAPVKAFLRSYVGNWWRSGQKSKPMPENSIFTTVATLMPALCYDNPAVTVKARWTKAHQPIASLMGTAINSWIKDVDLVEDLEEIALDMLFGFSYLKVGLEAMGDFAADRSRGVSERFSFVANRPYLARLEPSAAVVDAYVGKWDATRLRGDSYWRDIDDLRSDPRNNAEAVEKLGPGGGENDQKGRPLGGSRKTSSRQRVKLYDLYFPEYNQVATLALDLAGEGLYLRDPHPWKGPAEGPYILAGIYKVPGEVYPVGLIGPRYDQFLELNAHASAAANEAGTQKSFAVTGSPEVQTTVKTIRTGEIATVPGFSGSDLVKVDIGGVSPGRLEYVDRLRERDDRMSGGSDPLRGLPTGVTATEIQQVASAAAGRSDFISLKFRRAIRAALRQVGWYFFYDQSVIQAVSLEERDPMTGEMMQQDGYIQGGQTGPEDDWSGHFLDIEPYSMRRVDPIVEQQAAIEDITLVSQIAPLIMQTAGFINWAELLDDLGEARNKPDYAARVLNLAGLQMIGKYAMPGAMPGAPAQDPAGGLPSGANPAFAGAMAGMPMGAVNPPVAARPSRPSPRPMAMAG